MSSRNLKILVQDKVSLGLMLALAPAIGMMDFIWGNQLYDPVEGDAVKIMTMWFMSALITVLVGALASVREIVKEIDIYRRERAVNLKIIPYLLSKVWVGVFLALYQAGVLMITRIVFNNPNMPGPGAYFSFYVTLFLCTLCGYLIGLVISASAPNQNSAMMLIIAVLVPQFLFAGALLPLDIIPGGEAISVVMPTRWAFETFLNMSSMGEKLVNDRCFQIDKSDRKKLTDEQKEVCTCMGVNIFTRCANFPGILSTDYYDAKVKDLLSRPGPVEPGQPTAIPYPTAMKSPTPLPTPTLKPSYTPRPTPNNPADFGKYMDASKEDGKKYQDSILDQFTDYRKASEKQGAAYGDQRTKQGDDYAIIRQQQGDQYETAMKKYADEKSVYQESRQKAISSAEAILETMYDNYGRAFKGTVPERWGILGTIIAVLMGLLVFFQKRKDVI